MRGVALDQFPVLDRMLVPGTEVTHIRGRSDYYDTTITRGDSEVYLGTKRVWVADEQRIPLDIKALDSTAQHMALPFPRMWFEWYAPNPVIDDVHHRWAHCAMFACTVNDAVAQEKRLGAALADCVNPDKSWLAIGYFVNFAGDLLVEMPIMPLFILEDDYSLKNVAQLCRPGGWTPANKNDAAEDLTQAVKFMWPGIIAVGWLNCKNVTIDTHIALNVQPIQRRKKGKARPFRAPSAIDFHTIRLPGQPMVRTSTPRGGHHAPPRLHEVRGHFKTFTADKPLMGRHVGTFWWGWQVRGNPNRGRTITDYSMGDTNAATPTVAAPDASEARAGAGLAEGPDTHDRVPANPQ